MSRNSQRKQRDDWGEEDGNNDDASNTRHAFDSEITDSNTAEVPKLTISNDISHKSPHSRSAPASQIKSSSQQSSIAPFNQTQRAVHSSDSYNRRGNNDRRFWTQDR